MKLIEADAKKLLASVGIETPRGFFLESTATGWPSDQTWNGQCFIKAQVLQGRRGKSGLIRRSDKQEDFSRCLNEVRTALVDRPCAGFLVEAAVDHERELLVTLDLDRTSGEIRCAFSVQGGMDVSAAKVILLERTADAEKLHELSPSVQLTIRQLWELMHTQDLLSVEINPLAVLADGSCVALDAKIETDDAAAFRHPEWLAFRKLSPLGRPPSPREEAYAQLLEEAGHRGTLGRYVELDGDIALILSGGGASLVAMDALVEAGGRPSNYVEMSGNPDPEMVRRASSVVFSKPGIRGVWIAGSFANFTDIQATVGATLLAYEESGLRVPVVIRRDGPQAAAAEDAARALSERLDSPIIFHRAETSLNASAQVLVSLLK